jgi:hypothetical protein
MRSNLQDARGLHVVHGHVASNGGVNLPGSGDWYAIKQTTGTYIVRFFTPFKFKPTVSGSAGSFAVFYLVAREIDYCQVNLYGSNTPGTLIDGAFTFHAEGRR